MNRARRADGPFGDRTAWLLILAGALLTFLAHYPGHASLDTLLQIRDGLSREYQSNQPLAMSWLAARMHASVPGISGLLLLNVTIWSACAYLLYRFLVVRGGFIPRLSILIWFLFPVAFLYNGILWKDVLSGNLATLAFLLILPRAGTGIGVGFLLGSALIMAAALLLRQQAALIVPFLGLAIWMTASSGRRPWNARAAGMTALWLVAVALATQLSGGYLDRTAQSRSGFSTLGAIYQLTTFDLAGIHRHGGRLDTSALQSMGLDTGRLSEMFAHYHADRVDHLGAYPNNPLFESELGTEALVNSLVKDWWATLRANPLAYAAHRADHFLWLAGLRDTGLCLPFHFGIVNDPAELAEPLNLPPGNATRIQLLNATGHMFMDLFRPLIYAGLALIALVGLIYLRPLGWEVLAILQVAGLAYLASYLLIGIACDFRYAYFLVPTSLIGILALFIPRSDSPRSDSQP